MMFLLLKSTIHPCTQVWEGQNNQGAQVINAGPIGAPPTIVQLDKKFIQSSAEVGTQIVECTSRPSVIRILDFAKTTFSVQIQHSRKW